MNWFLPFRYYVLRHRERPHSCVPLLGGAMAAVGVAMLLPVGFRWLSLLLLLIDIGGVPMIVFALITLARKKRERP